MYISKVATDDGVRVDLGHVLHFYGRRVLDCMYHICHYKMQACYGSIMVLHYPAADWKLKRPQFVSKGQEQMVKGHPGGGAKPVDGVEIPRTLHLSKSH